MAARQRDETGKWEELPPAVVLETRPPARLLHQATTFWGLGCTAQALCMVFIFGHRGALTQPAATRVMRGEPVGGRACNIAIVASVGVPRRKREDCRQWLTRASLSLLSRRRRLTFLLDSAATTFSTHRNFKNGKKKAIFKLNSSTGADKHKDFFSSGTKVER